LTTFNDCTFKWISWPRFWIRIYNGLGQKRKSLQNNLQNTAESLVATCSLVLIGQSQVNITCVRYHCLWICRFLLRTLRTSCVNLKASKTGSKFKSAVSVGSLNQDRIGIALSAKSSCLKMCIWFRRAINYQDRNDMLQESCRVWKWSWDLHKWLKDSWCSFPSLECNADGNSVSAECLENCPACQLQLLRKSPCWQ
jgi:hypothetical protein